MRKIISASRRTDIPAFYGEWFMDKIQKGEAGYFNPYNKKPYLVSLKKDDVLCIIFWSKNFIPFTDKLKLLDKSGYKFYLNYTITNYSNIFENLKIDYMSLVENMKKLSDSYSAEAINWRYDPVIITDKTDMDYHLDNFYKLSSNLKKYVNRCYISFVTIYQKVIKNFKNSDDNGIQIKEINIKNKINFINKLSQIAESFNIKLYSCCNDFMVGDRVKKGHCIDINVIKELFYKNYDLSNYKIKPTREECGCTESIDIGRYNSCNNGCIYCYANSNENEIKNNINNTDYESFFIGESKSKSDYYNSLIKKNIQKELFDFVNSD